MNVALFMLVSVFIRLMGDMSRGGLLRWYVMTLSMNVLGLCSMNGAVVRSIVARYTAVRPHFLL